MVDTANRTFVSSVLFLDIVEYSKQSVTDQLALKQRFNELLVDALKHVAVSDRIALDTGDGAAVSFQGNPEDSLFAAMHLRDALAADAGVKPVLEIRFGINLGPVRLIKDINGQINIIGDGINAAQRVMSFADPGNILVSRSYFEVVSRLSDDYAKFFHDAGTRTDKHVREHAVYAIGSKAGSYSQAAPAQANSPIATGPAVIETVVRHLDPATGRKRWWLGAGAALVAFVILGISMRGAPISATVGAPDSAAPSPPLAVSAKPPAPVPATTLKSQENRRPAKAPATVPKPAQSTILLSISPWGDVYVDGKKRGASPPLKALSLTPGTHTIEVKNTTFPSYLKTIEAKSGVETRIVHKF